MRTYIIGVDSVPSDVGGIAFFENVREGTAPVAAYEAVGYRGGDIFIDHEITRESESSGISYPVYEILSREDFEKKYPTDVPDPMPAVMVQSGITEEYKEMMDRVFMNRDGAYPDALVFTDALRFTQQVIARKVSVIS